MKQSYRLVLPCALAAGLTFALPVAAQDYARTNQRGVYVGGNIGMNNDEETGFGLMAGYRVNRNFAVEGAYQDTGQANISGRSADTNAWEVTGVGLLPLNERFDLLGKLGLYRGRAHGSGASGNNNDVTFGLGAQYNVNAQLGVRVAWQRYADMGSGAFGAGDDLDMLKVGVVYSFQ